MSLNGDGDHDALANEEFDLLIIAMRAAREQTEAAASVVAWAAPVVRCIHAVAARESEQFPPPMREEVERAVARGTAYALSLGLKLWFNPELAR